MRRYLHTIVLVIFVVTFLFDAILWGAVPDLPEVGASIAFSAHKEAILASTYMAIGGFIDGAVAGLKDFGASMMTEALQDGFARIVEEPNVAMDLILSSTFNRTHGWVKSLYWAPPILLVLYAILVALRPKQLKLMRTR